MRWQVTKGTRGMPWHQTARTDVDSCDKLWGAAKQALNQRSPNGKTLAA